MLSTISSQAPSTPPPRPPNSSASASASNPPNPRSSSSSNIHNLLSPVPSSSYDDANSKKRKSPYMDASPRKSRSPSKVPRTPERNENGTSSHVNALGSGSPRAPLSSSRTALGHLLNDEDRPPLSKATSMDPDPDAEAVDADVLMHEDDEEPRDQDEEDDGEGPEGEQVEGDEEDDGADSEEDEDDEDEDDEDSGDESDDSDGSDIIEITGAAEGNKDAAVSVKTEPSDTAAAPGATDGAAAATGTEEVVNQLQPKKKKAKRARAESMDEDLPPPPPPMPTIRIEVQFGNPGETLDFNFREAAHEAGYAVVNPYHDDYLQTEEPPTAAETAVDTPTATEAAPSRGPLSLMDMVNSDMDATEMQRMAAALEAKYDQPKKKAKKRRVIDYDLNDPFIDDSDLKIDAPTHVARPKKEGFFVHQGVLELMEESPQKLKSRSKPKASKKEVKEPRKSLSEALRALGAVKHHGSRNSPILIDSDAENPPPSYAIAKRSPSPEGEQDDGHIDRVLYKSASRDPKYLPPFHDFPDEVAHYLRALRRLSNKHRWDLNNKGKFPEHLKPALQRAGEAAIHHDLLCIVEKDPTDSNMERYQEKAFVTALCSVLPYNKLTLGKLVLKLCYQPYWRWLQAREDEGLRQWKELLQPEIQPMIEAYEKEVAAAAAAKANAGPDEVDMTEDGDGKKGTDVKKMPAFTQDMKDIFRQLVENTQEQVDINKKMEEWGQRIEGQSSELNMRKFLYTRIINMYPEGYMTSLALSRAFTNFKRSGQGAKLKEEQALAAAQHQ